MITKQIHELPEAAELEPQDQLVLSTAASRLTRRARIEALPWRLPGTNARRLLRDKLAESVSVRDFGAVGDGIADDAPAFQAALDAALAVHVPPGHYRLGSVVHVRPRRRIHGAGRDAVVVLAQAERAFVFHRNEGAYAVDPAATNDWNRSAIEDLTIRMSTSGILARGHEFVAERLKFTGGAVGGWCIELEDSNECCLREISAGPGGGEHDLSANGIRLYATQAGAGVNYGDSLIEEIAIKLKSPGAIGILVEHTGSPVAGRYFVMNNILFNRVQVNSAGIPPGTTGVWLKRVMRSVFLNCDVELVDTAFRVEGAVGGGNAGSVRHLSFINCYVLNCNTPWVDSNATLPGSVMRCFFANCNGFGQINPVGVASGDSRARAGEGDLFLPSALWFPEPHTGQAAVQLRAADVGQLLVTGDFHDGASAIRDGNVKNASPRQGLGIDVTSFNVTRLYRPRGHSEGQESRIAIGNGEGHPLGQLHRVEIADPLYLVPRTSEPPQPRNGSVVYCENPAALPSGTPWAGPGWYARLANGWNPGVTLLGRLPERERNTNFTVTPADFGRVHRVNNAGPVVVTIASTYAWGGNTLPLLQAGDPAATFWLIRQGTGTVTVQAGDANVEIRNPVGGSTLSIRRQNQLVQILLRHNPTSGKIEVYGTTFPDAELLYEETLGWTNANQGTNTPTTPYVVPASRAGQLLRISSSDPVSYVAFEAASVPAGLAAATFRLTTVNNPIRIMARADGNPLLVLRRSNATSPGGHPCFEVSEVGRVVQVHVVTSDPHQPNSIFVEG
ncbi:MAG: glycosyl hydrolase family 28-related protein [Geminicoccaceae bacterium]|nr:glycoside hydrolase family 55 protein [Geminicoccaceae bacterium]MDW8340178.1 glycosyl hydrolase family 28-related protein [Geminicoccaceae bacterium]